MLDSCDYSQLTTLSTATLKPIILLFTFITLRFSVLKVQPTILSTFESILLLPFLTLTPSTLTPYLRHQTQLLQWLLLSQLPHLSVLLLQQPFDIQRRFTPSSLKQQPPLRLSSLPRPFTLFPFERQVFLLLLLTVLPWLMLPLLLILCVIFRLQQLHFYSFTVPKQLFQLLFVDQEAFADVFTLQFMLTPSVSTILQQLLQLLFQLMYLQLASLF